MSLLSEYEEGVERLCAAQSTRLDSLFDFTGTHLSLLRGVGAVEEGLPEYVERRGVFRRDLVLTQQRLETSMELRAKALESHSLRQAQQQQQQAAASAKMAAVGSLALMDFSGGIAAAAAREPVRVVSGELLASQVAAFSATERKRKTLDGEARNYAQLLTRLQQVTNAKALEQPELLMGSEVQAPLSEKDVVAMLEMQLLRRLQGQLRTSLAHVAALDRATLSLVVVPADESRKKRKSSGR